MSGRGVGAKVAATQSAAVGQGVLYATNAPSFLVKHQVVYDTTNGQLRVFFDGIVLEVFVATVAVHEVFPVGVAGAHAAAQRQAHGRAFHIERFIVLQDAQSVEDIDRIQIGFDWFEEESKTKTLKKLTGLGEIRALAEVQGECFEPAGADPKLAHDMVSHEKDRAAINAAGKGHPNRFVARNVLQPLCDFISQSADIAAADFVQILRASIALWGKETCVGRIGIRATDELQFHNVMRRNHPGITGMKLVAQAFGFELVVNSINAVSHNERGAFGTFGKKVPHGPVERASHPHGLPITGEQGE